MSEAVLIREATAADDAIVGELLVRSFLSQYARKLPDVVLSPERLADLRDQADKRAHATVLVAEDEGYVVGTVSLYRWGAIRSQAWIEGAADLRFLAVDAARQGRGVSGALLDAIEGYARSWQAPAICLHIRRGAAGIVRLYESRGYVREEAGDVDRLPEVYLHAYALRL